MRFFRRTTALNTIKRADLIDRLKIWDLQNSKLRCLCNSFDSFVRKIGRLFEIFYIVSEKKTFK